MASKRKTVKSPDEGIASPPTAADTFEPAPAMSVEDREAMVRVAAYAAYERRGFAEGSPQQDWLEAEQEVDRLLAQGSDPGPTGTTTETPFTYRGCDFVLRVEQTGDAAFLPHVVYLSGVEGQEQAALVIDTDAYGTAAEAQRHAEQQAMRWVHDRTGDGQGQF
jgi:hypothetical protein